MMTSSKISQDPARSSCHVTSVSEALVEGGSKGVCWGGVFPLLGKKGLAKMETYLYEPARLTKHPSFSLIIANYKQ